jgi:Uma2 family endonuclease
MDTLPPRRMSREEFRRWAEAQPRGRYERVDGEVFAMSPERSGHILVKNNVWLALRTAVRTAGLECQVFGDGLTVEVDEHTDYEPDAVVNCALRLPLDAIAATNPVVVVEVLSPSTRFLDAGLKLAGYFRVPAVRHYLLVDTRRRGVIHHARAGDRIETCILDSGPIALDPPGIAVAIEDFYVDVEF